MGDIGQIHIATNYCQTNNQMYFKTMVAQYEFSKYIKNEHGSELAHDYFKPLYSLIGS